MTRQGHTIIDAVAQLEAEILRVRGVLERISTMHTLTRFGPADSTAEAQLAYQAGAHAAYVEVAAIAGQALQEISA